MAQWLRLRASAVGCTSTVPRRGTKIPHASREVWLEKKEEFLVKQQIESDSQEKGGFMGRVWRHSQNWGRQLSQLGVSTTPMFPSSAIRVNALPAQNAGSRTGVSDRSNRFQHLALREPATLMMVLADEALGLPWW